MLDWLIPYNHPKYFYITTKVISCYSIFAKDLEVNEEYLTINNGFITIKSGYAFNGASPRWEWFGCEWGTPQGRGLNGMRGFCVHDALWQYGIDKKLSNKIQLDIHKQDNFKPANLYYQILNIISL